MRFIALIVWFVTALWGLYMLAVWLIENDATRQGKAASRLPLPVILGHVTLAVGTDSGGVTGGQYFGLGTHIEMELQVTRAGLTPMQALVAATSGAARVWKLDQKLGSIEAGKQADLLVLNANPLADIKNTRQIHSVWIGGRQLAQATSTN